MAGSRRLLKARDSLTHAWTDGSMTSFMPQHVYAEADVLEGEPAERKAFFDEAIRIHLFEDVTEEEAGEQEGGRRPGRPSPDRRPA